MIDQPLEFQIGQLLSQYNLHLGVAESCTGGLLGHRVTNAPGASAYFLGGVISYANEVKMQLLQVRQQTLEQYGAVSREVALEMARGIRRLFNCELGLSVTGIAGPDGGTDEKPVGLTWIGLSAPQGDQAWQFAWSGDRIHNKERSAEQALSLLLEHLQAHPQARQHSANPS